MRYEHEGGADTPFLKEELRRIGAIVRGIWNRLIWHPNSDVAEDCREEARTLLWQIRHKLEALPEAERRAYADTCIRHAVWRVLHSEFRHTGSTVSIEELKSVEGVAIELARKSASQWEGASGERLIDQVSLPELAEALDALSHEENELLDLFYAQEMTDPQIARRLRCSPAAIKMKRHRILTKLGRQLKGDRG